MLLPNETAFLPRHAATYFLGMAAFWPLIRRSSYVLMFSSPLFFLVFILASIIATGCMLVYDNHARTNHDQEDKIVCFILSCIASCVGVLGIFTELSELWTWFWVLEAVCYGTVLAFLSVQWGKLLSRCEIHQICLVALGSFAMVSLITLVMSLQSWISSTALIVLPLISALSCWRLSSDGSSKFMPHNRTSLSLIWVFVLFLLAGSIIRGLYFVEVGTLTLGNRMRMDAVTLLFCAAIVLIVFSGGNDGFHKHIFLRAWMLIAVVFFIGLVTVMTFRWDGHKWGSEIVLISRLLISLLLWILLACISKESNRHTLMMGLWVFAESASSLIAYYIIPQLMKHSLILSDVQSLYPLLAVALFTILIIASFFFLQRVISDLDTLKNVHAIENSYEKSCEELASEYGLSSRELEIMMLYAHGNSSKSIAERLYLSPDTVRTHVKNIYDKLGVHKKQDLIDLVQQRESPKSNEP